MSLTVTSSDTSVHMPLRTFSNIAALRMGADELLTIRAENIHQYNRELRKCNDELKILNGALSDAAEENWRLKLQVQEDQENLTKCAEKRERLKTWATIGKVVVISTGVTLGVIVYQQLRP